MTEILGMATLPINPNAEPDQAPVVVNGLLNVADYNPGKSYVVFGEATRIHKNTLRDFGGKFNGRLKEKPGFSGGPAWIFFDPVTKHQVLDFVTTVNDGTIPTQQAVPQQGNQLGLPAVAAPVRNRKFQWVKWKLFIPRVGMRATIKVNGTKVDGDPIYEVETHGDIVDTVWTSFNGTTAKLVICNGRWQVWGYMVEHNVFFGNPTVHTNPDHTNIDQTNPDQTNNNGNYTDIGGADVANV